MSAFPITNLRLLELRNCKMALVCASAVGIGDVAKNFAWQTAVITHGNQRFNASPSLVPSSPTAAAPTVTAVVRRSKSNLPVTR
jgi:hypothetical protein